MRAELIVLGAEAETGAEPAAIEKALGRLMRGYLRNRAPALAQAVAHHLEALISHPRYVGGVRERCVYHRLLRQWRWLAESAPGLTADATAGLCPGQVEGPTTGPIAKPRRDGEERPA